MHLKKSKNTKFYISFNEIFFLYSFSLTISISFCRISLFYFDSVSLFFCVSAFWTDEMNNISTICLQNEFIVVSRFRHDFAFWVCNLYKCLLNFCFCYCFSFVFSLSFAFVFSQFLCSSQLMRQFLMRTKSNQFTSAKKKNPK